jgi:pimeloyl-ACP methyl ester carboxylesterase
MASLPVAVLATEATDHTDIIGQNNITKATDNFVQESEIKLISIKREKLLDKIYEYIFIFQVGDGDFDKIGVHRVVKERRPWRPVKTKAGVVMTPGNMMDFTTTYMISTQTDAPGIEIDHSLAIYLAKANIDVWGIDHRRSFVPDLYPGTDIPYCYADPGNCSFMKDWDLSTQISDARTAINFARIVRSFTHQGNDQMFILGASRGGRLAYAYANQETQLPSCERNLKGIITVDIAYQFDPCSELWYCDNYSVPSTCNYTTASKAGCERCQILQSVYNSVGEMALSKSYIFKAPMKPLITRHHYCTGTFNETGHPTGLQFTNYDFIVDLAYNLDNFMSINCLIDEERVMCDNWATCDNSPPVELTVNCPIDDVPYADHLDEITIPVLYVGGETGFGGYYGNYTISLLGSEDKTILIVSGYGHLDVLTGDNAKTDVWKPIYKWIEKRKK